MRRWTLLLVLPLVLAGCTGGDAPTTKKEDAPTAAPAQPPWWNLGESWTIQLESSSGPTRTTSLVNFANHTFNDPEHFWLGTSDRSEALRHVFHDDNPFLGRIHWMLLAPHEKGMHSAMYRWPLEDGARWSSGILLGKEDLVVSATSLGEGRFLVEGEARADGSTVRYDYDPGTRWFRELEIRNPDGSTHLKATLTQHRLDGAKGTFYFLRGRDYLDSQGGSTGVEQAFTVKDEGATSIAFLLDVRTSGPASIEFVAPDGEVWHREALPLGGSADKIAEIAKSPPPGDNWRLRYVGSVEGTIKVRGIIEYKATL